MSDVLLAQTEDDGDITIPDGEDVTLTNGFETSDYLSLFGGNAEDDASAATENKQWWGNVEEPDKTRHLRSAFQALIDTAPLTSAMLQRLERAALRDLAWKLDAGLVDDIRVTVTVPRRNVVEVVIDQDLNGETMTSRQVFPWGSSV